MGKTKKLEVVVRLCLDHHNTEYVRDWSWRAEGDVSNLGCFSMESETEFRTLRDAKRDFKNKMKALIACVTGKPWPKHARLHNIKFVEV